MDPIVEEPLFSDTQSPFKVENSAILESRQDLTDKDILVTAKQILLGLGGIFLLCVVGYFISPERGSPFIDICKVVLPPLATLIIAFYFKEKSS